MRIRSGARPRMHPIRNRPSGMHGDDVSRWAFDTRGRTHTMGIWRPVGTGSWVGHDASTTFPTYTRGNAGEVYPEVFTPLSFSLAAEAGERAMRSAIARTGLVSDAELSEPLSTAIGSGVFGGYAYLNLSVQRLVAERLPGGSAADADANYLGVGTDIPPPDDDLPADRRASLRGLRYLLATIRLKNLPPLDDDRRRVEADLATHADPATMSDAELRSDVTAFTAEFEELFEHHLAISGQAGLCVGILASLLEERLDERDAVGELLAGIGDVDSAAPSFELWDLGRSVAADPALGALFDGPAEGRHARLSASPDAASFLEELDGFLERHGARGPNEWDTAFDTWGTDPDLALALVDRMRLTDDGVDPRARAGDLAARREVRTAEIRDQLDPITRRLFDRILHAAQVTSRAREQAKTTVVRFIQGSRVRAKELDRRLAERRGGDAGDLWFLVEDELDAYVADPASMSDRIAERRAQHRLLAERIPPFVFTGEQPPLDTWERRDADATHRLGTGDRLEGLPGCPGTATGRARVVLDPADPTALEPGDVLVAPLTDPSWTPLFLAASAVVVDVGAIMSHAVIVSRELGIPCVVSATGATRNLPDGAVIEVDGTSGTVTVIDLTD